ncbi:YsnF/AvaK domain-containing protein [Mucilaginibacter robiniae]|uniref:YsnF/AvaK domain-containing protein n=1 Tax=Mucilaginibacter robiniae TaxID=2728022 RepID=A0A7L5DXS9_9SPHI|nr:YsnF/AvaK domain-containing protein [Mucilaginibacter robiniae]QJD94829.1 YsnF/AvaK domain-containing protein [Mucilaginibacter robiniae]
MKDWKIFTGTEQNLNTRNQETAQTSDSVIPVVQEELHVDKKQIETGKVHVSKKVVTEPVNVSVPVIQEDVVVEKKAFNQYINTPPPGVRQEGDTTIISVVKEILVKQLVLVEEIHITKRRTETSANVQENLRKEEVTVNRITNL